MTEKQRRRKLARIKNVVYLLAALLQAVNHNASLDEWVAARLRLHQGEATQVIEKIRRGKASKHRRRRNGNGK